VVKDDCRQYWAGFFQEAFGNDAADCPDCTTREGKIDHFEREITLEGEVDAAQHAKLMEIADKCPVHRTLHGEVKVATRAA